MNIVGRVARATGRGLVLGMPVFLKLLAVVGTAAMIWVGGGILVHGLEAYGLPLVAHLIHDAATLAAQAVPALAGVLEWVVTAAGSGIVGLLVGAALIPLTGFVLAPAWKALTGLR
jgi:predicted DNA repair protein MutK